MVAFKRKTRVLLLVCGAIFAIAFVGRAISSPITLPEGWKGETVFDDGNGKFLGCTALGSTDQSTTLMVAIDSGWSLSLGFLNHNMHYPGRSKADVWIKFSKSDWYHIDGFNYDPSGGFYAVAPVPSEPFIDDFRRSSNVEVRFDQFKYHFDLPDAFNLLPTLAQCVKTNLDSNAQASGNTNASSPNESSQKPISEHGTFTGTGFVIAPQGTILTNHHVVDNCQSIKVVREGDIPVDAALVAQDVGNDLAVIRASKLSFTDQAANFRGGSGVRAGEQVAVYGFPLTGLLSVTGNIVSGNISSLAGLNDDIRFFQISAPVQPGNSGGPLLDSSGNVVGVVNARIDDGLVAKSTGTIPQNINFSIKANIATAFLDAHSIEYHVSDSGKKLELSDIAASAKKFTVLIICQK